MFLTGTSSFFQKNNEDKENEPIELIDIPVQDVVKFVLELTMTREGAVRAAAEVEAEKTTESTAASLSEGTAADAEEPPSALSPVAETTGAAGSEMDKQEGDNASDIDEVC